MSRCCIIEKVKYRLPGTTRLVWGMVLLHQEGHSLLLIPKPDEHWSHGLVIAAENVAERVYEDVNTSRFPLETPDLEEIGRKLHAIGDTLGNDDSLESFLREEGLW